MCVWRKLYFSVSALLYLSPLFDNITVIIRIGDSSNVIIAFIYLFRNSFTFGAFSTSTTRWTHRAACSALSLTYFIFFNECVFVLLMMLKISHLKML